MTIRKVLTTPDKKLRSRSRELTMPEMKSAKTKELITDIYETLNDGEYGVGMSAIQVGEPLAITVVMIRPTPNRPNLNYYNQVYFNLKILKTFGEKKPMWEGCCSVLDDNGNPLYAKVPRYEKIKVKYCNEIGEICTATIDGFLAHVLQHEIDHINGILFTDLIPSTNIVPQEEYRKAQKSGY